MNAPSRVELRAAEPRDHSAIAVLGVESFARFGDYRRSMSQWLGNPGIATFLAEQDGVMQGFAMIALLQTEAAPEACVLAVCVQSSAQGRGVGRLLLGHALERLGREGAEHGATEVFADVADDNTAALALFGGVGFLDRGPSGATYPGGQAARRLTRPLPHSDSDTIRPC
ncbi:MAG: GNAT family N-acetyltransferase [Deltaproteobacteria bacterium]|nr:GNAT family N-acetyltransferase [Deltaproteobacteria bacterium]